MILEHKKRLRQKRVWRIRKKVSGTAERPRLCAHFSNKHIYAQVIDDESGRTLLALSSLNPEMRKENLRANVESARKLGEEFGKSAVAAGMSKIVFDRNGRSYHGAVKAFADASRKAGLEF